MAEQQRITTRTTPTVSEWRAALFEAGRRLGMLLSDESLSVLYAQWALETGRGKSCFNDNLGNIKHVDGDGRDWMWLDTFEYIGGKRVNMADRFRAFDDLLTGALDYIAFLSRRSYIKAWTQVLLGNAEAFARALKDLGYYTADVAVYASGLKSLASEYFRAIAEERAIVAEPAPTQSETPASLLRASEAEHTVPLDDTPPGGFSIIHYAEDLYERLRGTLVCHTCEDPPSPLEAA